VAYNSNCLGGNGDIFITRADGSGTAVRRTNTATPGGSGFPAWSPNGLYIAFMRTTGSPNNYQVWVLSLATGTEAQLTTGLGDESEPTWSPDGQHIVYTCGSDLCIVDFPSGTNHQLTTGGHRDFDPAWSPDGTKILFSRIEDLWIINADGTAATQLTSGPAAGGADWVRRP
jgi:Tol biopolymer transport system component